MIAGQDMSQQFFRTLNAVVRPAVKAGIGSPLPIGVGTVVLETTGRLTGMPREVPLVALRLLDHLVVSTVRSDSQWLRNLEANPAARVWVCGRRHDVVATIERGDLNTVRLERVARQPADA